MNINLSKKLFFLVIFNLLTLVVTAQTITIGSVDAGPYGQGSTISNALNPTTTKQYKLYMVAEGFCNNTQKSIE